MTSEGVQSISMRRFMQAVPAYILVGAATGPVTGVMLKVNVEGSGKAIHSLSIGVFAINRR